MSSLLHFIEESNVAFSGEAMEGYGIFDGGGMKGGALAGAFAAAEARGIEFFGFAGTSAGSIVALLAAVGYSGAEIEKVFVHELRFEDLLDDDGKGLQLFDHLALAGGPDPLWLRKICATPTAIAAKRRLWDALGFCDGEKLKRFLLKLVLKKKPQLAPVAAKGPVRFEDLAAAGAKPLKLLATDLTNRRAAKFPEDVERYGNDVFAAVRASAGYPLVFRPVTMNGAKLVDGGLASNLPAFFFAEEHRLTRRPVIAFDLMSEPPFHAHYNCGHLVRDMLDAALEVSDTLIRGVASGVDVMPIHVPAGISATQRNTTTEQRQALFDCGFRCAGQWLANYEQLKLSEQAGAELQRQLQARYRMDAKVLAPVLETIAHEFEELLDVHKARTHVMLPTGTGRRVVVYHYNMEEDADSDLSVPLKAGCSGEAWSTQELAIANLKEARDAPADWGLSREEANRVPPDRTLMMSVPVFHAEWPDQAIATLSADTNTPGAFERVSDDDEALIALRSRLFLWANVISSMLS